MVEKQEFEGIGNHAWEFEEEHLSVEKWINRPDDLKGQSLTIGKLLPDKLRVNSGPGTKLGKKFKFHIIVETEGLAGN
jgi:hypothetical protein